MTVDTSSLKKDRVRVGLLSLGCPKTLVDSELVLGKLDSQKYSLAPSVADCDIAFVNTCAFIKEAQEESVDQILRLVELKKEGRIQKLIILGCLVQRFASELQRELTEVDAFVGSGEYDKIPEIIAGVLQGKKVSEIGIPGYLYTSGERRIQLTPSYWRYLKISEGCDHACSFCVIPNFRGKHRSRALEDVVQEAEELAAQGAREIILTGQDTTFFGYDLTGRYLLPELLHRLNQISGLRWIRILYAYPSLVSDELIEAVGSLGKVCHYLDMPLQHVNKRILKSMRRGTTPESIRHLIHKLRRRIPDLALRTTFIVGYPGETEEEFQELLNLMEEARFERLGIFTYSPEEGSAAARLPGQIPERIKQKRFEKAMLLQQKISKENNSRFIEQTLEVLVESRAEDGRDLFMGRTYMDAPEVDGAVYFVAGNKRADRFDLKPGEFVQVKIHETREYDLMGQILGLPCT